MTTKDRWGSTTQVDYSQPPAARRAAKKRVSMATRKAAIERMGREELLLAASAKLKSRILDARKDPAAFAEFVMRTPKGARIVLEDFHREWYSLFREERRVQVEAAKSHGKTTTLLAFILWVIGTNPNIRIKLFAQSEEKAKERLQVISGLIDANKLVRLVFPGLKRSTCKEDPWRTSKITVERSIKDPNATLEVSGIMGSVEGGRADLVIFDDISDHRNAIIFPKHREAIKKKVYAEILPMLEEDGRAVSIGTPHVNCLHPISNVQTIEGRKRSCELTKEDRLWVAPGVYEKPKVLIRLPTCKSMFRIDLWCHGEPLRLTGGHRALTQRGVILVRNLKTGDRLPIEGWAGTRTVLPDAFPYEPPARQERPKKPNIKSRLSKEQLAADLVSGMTYGQIAEKHGYSTGKKYILYLVSCYGLPRRKSHQVMNPAAPTDERFWRLIGYWLAEGSLNTSGWNNAVQLSFGPKEDAGEQHLAHDAKQIIEEVLQLPARLHHNKDGNATYVNFRCKAMVAWLKRHFGWKQPFRRLPYFIEQLPEPFLRQALLGWILGDGDVQQDYTRGSTASIDLASDWQRVLVGLGVASRVNRVRNRKSGSTKIRQRDGSKSTVYGSTYNYVLHITGDEAAKLGLPRTERPRKKKQPLRTQLELRPEGNRLWLPIRKIKPLAYRGPVLDIGTTTGYFATDAVKVHNSDVIASLRRNPEWLSRIFAVGTDEDPFLPLWAKRWPRAALKRLQSEVGMTEYNRAYRCCALAEKAAIVRPEHIAYYDREMLGDPWNLICLQAYDLAITDKRQSSFFACVTLLYDQRNDLIFVADAWKDKLEFAAQAQAIVAEAARWQPNRIVVEETGYQRALREYLIDIAESSLPIFPISPANKSKELRLTETLPMFETGRVFFNPALDPKESDSVSRRGDLITELINFTMSDEQDLGDAFSHGVRALRFYRMEADDNPDDWEDGDGMSTRIGFFGK